MTEKLDLDVNLIKAVERLNDELQPFIQEEQDRAESLTRSAELKADDNVVPNLAQDMTKTSSAEDADNDNLGA